MINQRPCCLVVIWTAAIEAYHELKLTKGLAKLLIKSCCATDMDFQGLRPPIPSHSHPELADLLKRCWQRDPFFRPEFSEILELLQQLERTVADERDEKQKEKCPRRAVTAIRWERRWSHWNWILYIHRNAFVSRHSLSTSCFRSIRCGLVCSVDEYKHK